MSIHAALPATLSAEQRARADKLIRATKAGAPVQANLRAAVEDLLRDPYAGKPLVSRAFTVTRHPFNSLRRVQVDHARIVYGLLGGEIFIVHIGDRQHVYHGTISALENWKSWVVHQGVVPSTYRRHARA